MKILFVTNLYPPHHVGGYELGCRDVVEKLHARGHTTRVLTSSFRLSPERESELEVERSLHLASDVPLSKHNKFTEGRKLFAALRNFKPDVIYFWNQANLCPWLPVFARIYGYRTVFFLSDTNFSSWRVGAWMRRFAQGEGIISNLVRKTFGNTFLVRGWPVIKSGSCHFASEFLRVFAKKNGICLNSNQTTVAHWGIDLAQFPTMPRQRWPVRNLLYVGQMIPQKGIHTAIAAFALLVQQKGFEEITFSIAGGGFHPEYEKKLRDQVVQLGLGERVSFLGKVARAELPRIYATHDVLVFPSEWDEPFAITPLEAIASGLAVVGTTTGGSSELFRNHETAMTFQAGVPNDCARAITELVTDLERFQTICRNAKFEVLQKHTLDIMVNLLEKGLLKIS